MGDGLTVAINQLGKLEVDLARAPARNFVGVQAATRAIAIVVRNDWRRRWRGLAHAPAIAAAVTYDVSFGLGKVHAEIGPERGRRQAPLGNLLEYGSVNNAPIPGGRPALDKAEPGYVSALDALAGRIV